MPDTGFIKRLASLVSVDIVEKTPEDAYRWIIEALRIEAERYYSAILGEPPITDEHFRRLRDEHARLMQDITLIAGRLAILEGNPLPEVRLPIFRKPSGAGPYGGR